MAPSSTVPNDSFPLQAPVPGAIVDYWRMVWQERITLIVCLTSLKERGNPKADIFFPPEMSRPFRAGPFRIIAESINPIPGHHRVMLIHLRLRCWFARRGTPDRLVVMIYYGTWPDTAVSSRFLVSCSPLTHASFFAGAARHSAVPEVRPDGEDVRNVDKRSSSHRWRPPSSLGPLQRRSGSISDVGSVPNRVGSTGSHRSSRHPGSRAKDATATRHGGPERPPIRFHPSASGRSSSSAPFESMIKRRVAMRKDVIADRDFR